ncbi:unnamed protein product [Candidula unifasciata]|uniref:Protein rolling stone n=1 Tax=Candidula unifasciata TaxID=100452 RepID=A0A8S4A3W2_9EUPU|nr:unnamed protein product [Candidula unifasciata]
MGVTCREEFQYQNLCFHETKPYKFTRSQWRISQETYILWRLFWALWHFAWLAFSIQLNTIEERYSGEQIKWLIYLSNWSYAILTAQSCLHTGIICYIYVVKKEDMVEENIQWYLKVLWLLTTFGFDSAILVTALYWTLVFDGAIKTFLTVATHAINSVYVLMDIFLIAAPVRLLHIVYPIMYGLAYTLFTFMYHIYGGTNKKSEPFIYKPLDWSKLHSALTVSLGSVFVGVPAVHLLQFGLYALRLHILETSKCCNRCANIDRETGKCVGGKSDPKQTKMAENDTNECAQTLVDIEYRNKISVTSQYVDMFDNTTATSC